MIESQTGRPQIVTPIAMMIPANPTIDPMERSNSPAIMSSATDVRDDPDLGSDVQIVECAGQAEERGVARAQGEHEEHDPDEDDDDQRAGRGAGKDALRERELPESAGTWCRAVPRSLCSPSVSSEG